MEDAIVARVARTLSAQSRRRNSRDNRQDNGRPTCCRDNYLGRDFASSRSSGNDNRREDRGRQKDHRFAAQRFPPRGLDNGDRGGQRSVAASAAANTPTVVRQNHIYRTRATVK